MTFEYWFNGATYRAKYDKAHPVYLAAKEAWDAQQAEIDRLMLEYCPEEMTPAQVEEWGRNQKPVSAEEQASIEASLCLD